MSNREMARGSVWRQWDLHVHTPASFHWTGKKFEGDLSSPENRALIDEMINAMCGFHGHPATHSMSIWPPIPR